MKRRNKSHLSAWQVYSDQLLLILGYFMMMATLLIIVPHLKQAHDGIKPKAEYLVTLTYDDHRNADIDLWLKHDECVVYFQSKECVNISLDRDSRGYLSNLTVEPDGTRLISPNQEVIAIRAKLPGDYLTAVNYYDAHSDPAGIPIDCKVELIELNPTVRVVQSVTIHLDSIKQTLNAIAFHVDSDGKLTLLPLPPEDLISTVSPP